MSFNVYYTYEHLSIVIIFYSSVNEKLLLWQSNKGPVQSGCRVGWSQELMPRQTIKTERESRFKKY